MAKLGQWPTAALVSVPTWDQPEKANYALMNHRAHPRPVGSPGQRSPPPAPSASHSLHEASRPRGPPGAGGGPPNAGGSGSAEPGLTLLHHRGCVYFRPRHRIWGPWGRSRAISSPEPFPKHGLPRGPGGKPRTRLVGATTPPGTAGSSAALGLRCPGREWEMPRGPAPPGSRDRHVSASVESLGTGPGRGQSAPRESARLAGRGEQPSLLSLVGLRVFPPPCDPVLWEL